MPRRWRQVAGDERRLSFTPVFDDLEEVPAFGIREGRHLPTETIRAEALGALAGRFEPVGPVLAAQPHQPQTRAVALLWVRPPFQNAGDEPAGGVSEPANSSAAARVFAPQCIGGVEAD